MHVHVKDRLPARWPHVQHGPISILDAALAGDIGRRQVAVSDDVRVFAIGFLQSAICFLGTTST